MTEIETRLPGPYWRQFAASAVSNLGDGANAAAMPLLAITLTDDARLISLVAFSSMVPWLVLSLPAGVWLDRWDTKRVIVTATAVRAAMYALIAALVATDTVRIWSLLAALLVIGCAEVFFDMGSQAFLPSIVPASALHRANGLLYSVEVVTNSFIGLPLGSWLFVIAAGVPFGINGAALALAAVLVATIRQPGRDGTEAPPATRGTFLRDLREGMSWLWHHRKLRTLAVLLGVTNGALMFGEAIFVKFAFRYLDVGPRGYGLLLALTSVGAILGGLLGDRIAGRLGVATSIIGAYAVFTVADAVRAAFPSIALFAVMSIAVSLAGTVWNVVTVSYRQRVIPAELFGRVNSAYRFIGTGSIALGAAVGGQTAHYLGLRAPYFLGSAVTAAALVWGLPVLRSPGFADVGADSAPSG
ncbi:MAG: MFS transporter [Actinomycetota bacterium]